MLDVDLLYKLCTIHAPSGEEEAVFSFCKEWIAEKDKTITIDDTSVFNALFFKKGIPQIAFLLHADTVGFILQYGNRVFPLGSPQVRQRVSVKTANGIEAEISVENENFTLTSINCFERGTTFTYKPLFTYNDKTIESAYLDNRLNIAIALESLVNSEHGMMVLTSNEETCGGSVEKVARILFEKHQIEKVIVLDTTFASEGITPGNGLVLTVMDYYLPTRKWLLEIKNFLETNSINYQLEIADFGSSDGGYIHTSPYPIQWCFLGIACQHYHSPNEIIQLSDVKLMKDAIKLLFNKYVKQ